MGPEPSTFGDRMLDLLDPLRWARALARPRPRYLLSWAAALAGLSIACFYALTWGNDPRRGDGNNAHTNIDFGGQWLMGRMVVAGRGPHLYHRNHLREVATAGFPREAEAPDQPVHDADALMDWTMGRDDPDAPATFASFLAPLAARDPLSASALLNAGTAPEDGLWTAERLKAVTTPRVGGALYPPVHALLWSPLSLLPPQQAYRTFQLLIVGLIFLTGWVIERLTTPGQQEEVPGPGKVWWPLAILYLLSFPGCSAALNLGQNPMVSLALLVLGWWLLDRGRPYSAGVAWGFLAFKPVWAAAFLLVPLLTRRWRMAAAMCLTGAALILATLPFVGWRAWLDWIAVGRIGARGYVLYENWVFLSRDLVGLPHRWMLDFADGWATNPERTLPTVLGWTLWAAVLAGTVFLAWKKRREPAPLAGPGAAFVLLGAWLACYRFMYYDVLLAALPVILLFRGPGRYFAVRFLRACDREAMDRQPAWWDYYRPALKDPTPPPAALLPGAGKARWVYNPFPPTLLAYLIVVPFLAAHLDHSHHFPPFSTLGLLALWGWCGWKWWASEERREDETVGVGLVSWPTTQRCESLDQNANSPPMSRDS
jgi:arabinofuranan 3-O-arabinosyltransferase